MLAQTGLSHDPPSARKVGWPSSGHLASCSAALTRRIQLPKGVIELVGFTNKITVWRLSMQRCCCSAYHIYLTNKILPLKSLQEDSESRRI
jgi:hypothetical protein